MNAGHVAVVGARGHSLLRALESAIRSATLISRYFPDVDLDPYVWTDDVEWESQRVASACDKALTGRPRDPETGLR